MKLSYFKEKKIDSLCKKADQLLDNDLWEKAIDTYLKVIDILPEPKTMWEAYNWVYTTIGDIYFLNQKYEQARSNLLNAYLNEEKDAFLYLRLGQTFYYLGDNNKAEIFLQRAYELSGESIFEGEDILFVNMVSKKEKEKSKQVFMFHLPAEYEYLEVKYFENSYLFDGFQWDNIYKNNKELLKEIPEILETNTISWLVIKDILEASIHLNKIDELDYWFKRLVEVSRNRGDIGAQLVWMAIIESKKGNHEKSHEILKDVEKNSGIEQIKNFHHFKNKVYDYYIGKSNVI